MSGEEGGGGGGEGGRRDTEYCRFVGVAVVADEDGLVMDSG